jgi:quercetin dioxygenase-like cupin family protein
VTVVAALVLTACGGDDGGSTPPEAEGVTEVVRQLLAEASPDTAAGQLLELTRVIVPAGEGLGAHTHPGPQLAVIVTGRLTYTVIEGEATVNRAAASAGQAVETYGAGETVELRAGDALVEPTGMVHRAINETQEIVIIYLSSLFPEGAPPATTVE